MRKRKTLGIERIIEQKLTKKGYKLRREALSMPLWYLAIEKGLSEGLILELGSMYRYANDASLFRLFCTLEALHPQRYLTLKGLAAICNYSLISARTCIRLAQELGIVEKARVRSIETGKMISVYRKIRGAKNYEEICKEVEGKLREMGIPPILVKRMIWGRRKQLEERNLMRKMTIEDVVDLDEAYKAS
jgi:hypothetical protein